jgi:hypothetical protein
VQAYRAEDRKEHTRILADMESDQSIALQRGSITHIRWIASMGNN